MKAMHVQGHRNYQTFKVNEHQLNVSMESHKMDILEAEGLLETFLQIKKFLIIRHHYMSGLRTKVTYNTV